MFKIFAINLGSTSTKLAYYEDMTCVAKETIRHDAAEFAECPTVFDQKDLREKAVLAWLEGHGVSLDELDAFVTRGGQTQPVEGGVYLINEAYRDQALSGLYGTHVCSVGSAIALDLTRGRKALPLTVDTPCTDEFEPLARYTGLPELKRASSFQALNSRAMAREYARLQGRAYEDMDLITVMLGGGIAAVAHRHGRMVDGPDGLEGDGCFSNNRCNGVPVGQLVRLCYSGRYTLPQMMRHVNGEAGLQGYLGTTDIRAIEASIDAGDDHAREVLEAMCYQASKDVAAMAAVLAGSVDAIVLTGGMANSARICGWIEERVGWIAPVCVLPGERELESLCESACCALRGEVPIHEFVPQAQDARAF